MKPKKPHPAFNARIRYCEREYIDKGSDQYGFSQCVEDYLGPVWQGEPYLNDVRQSLVSVLERKSQMLEKITDKLEAAAKKYADEKYGDHMASDECDRMVARVAYRAGYLAHDEEINVLKAKIETLEEEHAIWQKHAFVNIVRECDRYREKMKALIEAAHDVIGMYRKIYCKDPTSDDGVCGFNGAMANLLKALVALEKSGEG